MSNPNNETLIGGGGVGKNPTKEKRPVTMFRLKNQTKASGLQQQQQQQRMRQSSSYCSAASESPKKSTSRSTSTTTTSTLTTTAGGGGGNKRVSSSARSHYRASSSACASSWQPAATTSSSNRYSTVLLANLKTAFMLFVVTLIMAIVYTPPLLTSLHIIDYNPIHWNIIYINNAANPIVYSFLNYNFRKNLKSTFRFCLGRLFTGVTGDVDMVK